MALAPLWSGQTPLPTAVGAKSRGAILEDPSRWSTAGARPSPTRRSSPSLPLFISASPPARTSARSTSRATPGGGHPGGAGDRGPAGASVTVDPQRATPEVVSEYAEAFHPAWFGLPGAPNRWMRPPRLIGVYYAKSGDDPTPPWGALLFQLVGAAGRWASVDFVNPRRASAAVAETPGLLSGGGQRLLLAH
jgi:hypothetical protein